MQKNDGLSHLWHGFRKGYNMQVISINKLGKKIKTTCKVVTLKSAKENFKNVIPLHVKYFPGFYA